MPASHHRRARAPLSATSPRDIAAITYAANPSKKGLDRVLSAWRRVRMPSEELVVAGVSAEQLQRAGLVVPGEEGVRVVGTLSASDYRALVRRARVFVCARAARTTASPSSRRSPTAACSSPLPAPGPYAALPIARALDPRLVGGGLEGALRAALDDPLADYAARAREALAPFTRQAVDRLVAEELLPRLLA